MKAGAACCGLAVLGALLTAGCSWQSVQRTGYETVESLRQQQCMDQIDTDCPSERTRYDDYQSERGRLQETPP